MIFIIGPLITRRKESTVHLDGTSTSIDWILNPGTGNPTGNTGAESLQLTGL